MPITAHWRSKERPIFISTGNVFERAYLLDGRGTVVARIDPKTFFAAAGEEHSIGGESSVKAEPSRVFPLTTCAGQPAGSLPAGRYRLVVAARADVGASDLVYVPHEGGELQTVVSAPVPVEIR